ncbi:MAG: hypothetical protein JO210_00740 [Acidobacteriaceae bacterium]|nr:hypothetical protein [Acidobacteriaceae bacterium]
MSKFLEVIGVSLQETVEAEMDGTDGLELCAIWLSGAHAADRKGRG